ncbi:hypothetical protein SporoP37_10515 [Sporosarcina sp. P37]|uniref:hypothetical protein n=1 Tax=unclassified Sporosarcina TaxID=2647733 RepID=UPI000A17B497|nr:MULTISPECIES: hypothetical protein [unclassified Sporosarcina]ARK25037.1 hypothetical protein SporoP37_10515 [Sporosarcina sp. P37]PID18183.1 hypothetical protein CSV62_09850 [Sporosarcina sp. P35]
MKGFFWIGQEVFLVLVIDFISWYYSLSFFSIHQSFTYYPDSETKNKNKEVLTVSFEDAENVVTGTPQILIDPNTYKVIGYMPTE